MKKRMFYGDDARLVELTPRLCAELNIDANPADNVVHVTCQVCGQVHDTTCRLNGDVIAGSLRCIHYGTEWEDFHPRVSAEDKQWTPLLPAVLAKYDVTVKINDYIFISCLTCGNTFGANRKPNGRVELGALRCFHRGTEYEDRTLERKRF